MQPAERQEFDVLMAHLCAGFNVPVGDRGEAYWRGLEKMPLPTFARVVDRALGPDGPEKIPTSGQCWSISRLLRARPTAFEHDKPVDQHSDIDPWLRTANAKLFDYLQVVVSQRTSGRYGRSTWNPAAPPESRLGWDHAARIRVGYLVEAKNAWALEMLEGGDAEHAVEHQRATWRDLIQHAERRIDEHIAQCGEHTSAPAMRA